MTGSLPQLLMILDQVYDRKSWHGTNLRGAVRGLNTGQVVWRPAPRRHNIQELVVHAGQIQLLRALQKEAATTVGPASSGRRPA